jgi:hypothetical protein
MPDSENTDGIQSVPAESRPAPAASDDASTSQPSGGEFGALRAFPENPYQTSELPPPKSPVAELVAGAILGGLLGLKIGGLSGLLVISIVGALDGLWVGYLVGRAGTLSVWSVTVNLFRIPFVNVSTIFFPFATIAWSMNRDYQDR